MRLALALSLCLCGCPPGDPGPADLPPPDLLPEGACAAEIPCTMGVCREAGAFVGCGACREADPADVCQKDDDCKARGADYICERDARDCLCTSAALCRKGCGDCGEAETCGADHRCAGRPCAADGDCPAHFECSAAKRCERATCRTSAECGAGFCVGGACFADAGRCALPPP